MGLITNLISGGKAGGDGSPAGAILDKLRKKKKNRGQPDKAVQDNIDRVAQANIDSYKWGGKVKRTGLARLHKGERVLTVKQARARTRKARD